MTLRKVSLITLILLVASASLLTAQEPEQKYMMPPTAIAELVDAPFTPRVSVSYDNEWMLLLHYPGLPSIEEVAQPELRLAGIRINPRNNGPSRGWYYHRLTLRKIDNGTEYDISGLPAEPHITNVEWSPDNKHIAFVLTFDDHLELWAAEVRNGRARRLTTWAVNDAIGTPYYWVSDSKTIIAKTIPTDRGAPPEEPLVPDGPIIQENIGGKTPARTYQDLLENPYDEDVFDYYSTSQLVKVTFDGESVRLGQPAVYTASMPSPNGKFILAEAVHKPYSYTVPYYRFPLRSEVWDMTGQVVTTVANLPLADNIPVPFGSTRTGRRDIDWRNDADAALHWVEALDGGDAGREVDQRDRVYLWPQPFENEPRPLITLSQRYSRTNWADGDLAIVSEWWWPTRNYKYWRVKPDSPESEPELLFDFSWEDRYNHPGELVTHLDERGEAVLLTADRGRKVFLIGDGASDEGDRPFLDAFDLTSKATDRLFRSQAPYYERPVRLIDMDKGILLTRREAVKEPPNYYLRNLNEDELTQLTEFPHPTPQLADVHKELVKYTRSDGVELTATLYLPPGYDPEADGPLPMIMWAYPREFKSADAAGQVQDSPYQFVRISWYSPLLFLAHGYAVLDHPTMPIVGEEDEEPNDTYVEQLVMSAQAAVDDMVHRGVGDPGRMAIGGHSYGAFMAANLLAHSDLYAAGIARSGAYNRTLTPFGFQSEERTYWEAPEVYYAMSPFMHANDIDEPLLLIHGEADNNSGTYPLQSERFYAALKGHGATVRLCMLPHESHGYRARESVMHVLYEMASWLDTYVKDGSVATSE